VIRDTNFLSTPCIAAVSDVGLHLSGRFGQIGYHYKLQDCVGWGVKLYSNQTQTKYKLQDSTKDVFYSTKRHQLQGYSALTPTGGSVPCTPAGSSAPRPPS